MSRECPSCGGLTNSSNSRLIQDTCGHEKCRICLLYEEDGCKACRALRKTVLSSEEAVQDSSKNPQCQTAPASVPLEDPSLQNSHSPPPKKFPDNPKPIQSSVPQDPHPLPKPSKPPDRNHIITLAGHPERYKCTLCLKIFRNKKGKCYHDVCRTGVSPYHCSLCDKTFVKKSHFEYHERVHTGYKPFSCKICSKAFPQKNKLNRHMQSHDPEKKFLCSVCGKRYNKKDDLAAHTSVHSGTKPHICSTCGKSFRVRTSLTRHTRIHSSERPFICDDCGKSFKDKSLLARHKRTHGKDRPYSCAHCTKVFLSKSELRRHISSHSDLKPFACKFCPTVFRRKDNLIRHIRHHHMLQNPPEGSSGTQQRKRSGRKTKDAEEKQKSGSPRKASSQSKLKKGKPMTTTVSLEDSTTQINSRMDARGVITPVIRAPGELSNAVPVINGPISIKRPWEQVEGSKPILNYTQPLPIAEALVLNQRIEEKLYQGSVSNNSCWRSREPHMPISILPPLGQNSAIRALPTGSHGRRASADSNFSPPNNGILIELKSTGLGEKDILSEENGRKGTIVAEERVQVMEKVNKAEGTNCVSTIKKNVGFEGESKAFEHHWRRRTAESLKPNR